MIPTFWLFFVCLASVPAASCTRDQALRHYECVAEDCPNPAEMDSLAGFWGLDRSLHYQLVYAPRSAASTVAKGD